MNETNDNKTEGFKSLTLDIEYYEALLNDPKRSSDQKREFIETIWPIVVQFIDWGYCIHPILQADEAQASISQSLRRLIEDVAQTHFEDNEETTPEGAEA